MRVGFSHLHKKTNTKVEFLYIAVSALKNRQCFLYLVQTFGPYFLDTFSIEIAMVSTAG